MAKVTFGIFGMRNRDAEDLMSFARRVEELGFDGLWTGESPTNRGPSMDTFATLCYAAAATKRIRIGSNVTLLPLHNPAWVAKQWGTLDILSKGRSVLTIGPAGEYPKQFEAFGQKVEERGRRTDECIEVINNLWTEQVSNYKGRFFQFEGITMEPKPLTKPHPPIWVGGRPGGIQFDLQGNTQYKSRTAAIKRAATLGDGWCPYYMTLETYRDSVKQIKAYAKEIGRNISKMAYAYNAHIWIRDSYEKALQDAAGTLRYGRDIASRIEGYDILGSPKDIIGRIERFADAGVEDLVLHVNAPAGQLDQHLQVLATKVMPHFQ